MNSPSPTDDGQYKVVALKYRPQLFGELVGQSHIATALSNAIDKNRVGHAYLFTGARGVGKTSSARIFAKCLNCVEGPTKTPCGKCSICEAVSAGDDVDVLEIDGASNRGIDEIRLLRSNASVRPSRCKYKIYIIDEVHMLTMQAFNALLKTLEEPPPHVKFIFCTTDPQKIPITVLSRCQRFDFSPVQTNEISKRLGEIAANEGVTADEQALALLARRANGSMRDSQSLLEQLFSFCGNSISVQEVHELLGTADMGRIADISTAMVNADPMAALNLIHHGITDGVDAGQMADQLLGYFRDMMVASVDCGPDTFLNCSEGDLEHLKTLSDAIGLETILTIVQLLDSAVVRMQSSLHGRTLLEAAVVRVCNLEKLETISELISQLSDPKASKPSGGAVPRQRVEMRRVDVAGAADQAALKKNGIAPSQKPQQSANVAVETEAQVAPVTTSQPRDAKEAQGSSEAVAVDVPVKPAATVVSASAGESPATGDLQPAGEAIPSSDLRSTPSDSRSTPSDTGSIEAHWKTVLETMGDMTAEMAANYESVELKGADQLLVTLRDKVSRDLCMKPERRVRFEEAFEKETRQAVRVEFLVSQKTIERPAPKPKLTRAQQVRKLQDVALVKEAMELFDAEITGFREPIPSKKR
ncbi:MAG: DNA polymerase III subunit gamma/tau [Planctomycetaceae bacterium]|nr:DNA polymerase III subunit gamma/tau [Planctomycetaceae bacterium]